MNPYAAIDELRPVADAYELPMPDGPLAQRALDLAAEDIERFLGATYDPALLPADEQAALREATCIQAVFRISMGADAMLGVQDDIASAGLVSFSGRPLPRLSPEAAERVCGFGLFRRSGTVGPDPDPDPDPDAA